MKFEKLYKKRTEKGLTSASMAKELGISKAYYCQIENRNRRLSYQMAYNISNIFKSKPDDLFYDELQEKK